MSPRSRSRSLTAPPSAARKSSSSSSRVACVRHASWHRYHATSSAGVPSPAMSQSSRTTRPSAKPRFSSRRSPWMSVVPPAAHGPGQRRRIAQVGEHGLGDVVVGRLGERLPGDLELLGDHVAALALGGGHGGRADRQVALERDRALDGLVAEGRVQRGGRRHHLAVARAADRPVGGDQGAGQVAHEDAPAVAVGLDGDDAGLDDVREALQDARVPEVRGDRAPADRAPQPVAAGHHALGDARRAVGQRHALERRAAVAPAEARRRHRVDPVARDHVAGEVQVVPAAHAVARGGQRGAGGPLARAPLADLAGAVPPRGELGRDRVAPVAAHAPAGQRGLEHRVARVGRRQRVDVAGGHRGTQRVEGPAHGSTSALIASPLRASSSARPVSSRPTRCVTKGSGSTWPPAMSASAARMSAGPAE